MRSLLRCGGYWTALLLALSCGGLAVIGQAGRFSPLLDVANHFTLVWLAGCGAALLIWLAASRRGWLTPALAGIGLACCLGLVLPEALAGAHATRPPPAGARPLRLLQFNVWKDDDDPVRTAAWIAATHADIAAVEDSAGGGGRQVIALIAQHYPYSAHWGDSYVFSQAPITAWRPLRGGASLMVQTTAPDGRPVAVGAAHLGWPLQARMQAWQRQGVASGFDDLDRGQAILAGDFNLTPFSFAMRDFDARLGLQRRTHGLPTWPARWALIPAVLPIDQIFAGSAWTLVSLQRGPRLGSDHYPLLATLARS